MAEKINNINIEVSPEVSKGTYSNLAIISHAPTEIVMDFAQMLPGQNNNAIVRDRVIMAPFHAKQFLAALADNIQKYESQYGTIPTPNQPMSTKDAVPFDILGKA